MDFSFSSDPEFFLTKDSEFYSAVEIVRADRKSRLNIEGHEFFHDNVLAECAIKYGNTKQEVLNNFKQAIRIFANLVKPYKLTIKAFQEFSLEQLTHPDAQKVNCAIERCPYIKDFAPTDELEQTIKNTGIRTAGGHVHLGAEILRRGLEAQNVVKMLDIFVGLPFLFISCDDSSTKRRKMYGKAGRHRRPAYGVEYRTPDNYWLTSPDLVSLMYDLCEFTIDFANEGGYQKMCENEYYNESGIQIAINHSQALLATRLLMKVTAKHLPESLFNRIVDASHNKSGINFYKEWGLI